jgi:hypothetical protein
MPPASPENVEHDSKREKPGLFQDSASQKCSSAPPLEAKGSPSAPPGGVSTTGEGETIVVKTDNNKDSVAEEKDSASYSVVQSVKDDDREQSPKEVTPVKKQPPPVAPRKPSTPVASPRPEEAPQEEQEDVDVDRSHLVSVEEIDAYTKARQQQEEEALLARKREEARKQAQEEARKQNEEEEDEDEEEDEEEVLATPSKEDDGVDDSADVVSARQWSILDQSGSLFLQGAENSKVSVQRSLLRQVTSLTPKELADMIEEGNKDLDGARAAKNVSLRVVAIRGLNGRPVTLDVTQREDYFVQVRLCKFSLLRWPNTPVFFSRRPI